MVRKIFVMILAVAICASWITMALADSRFVFSDTTVKDKRTGLIWTRDANLGRLTWDQVINSVNELNRQRYGGFSDWRLPSKEELETLGKYARGIGYNGSSDTRKVSQLLNQIGFYDVQADRYWSSSFDPYYPSVVRHVSMVDGLAHIGSKNDIYYIWPVRNVQ